jgi:hypothetical protein
MSAGIFFQDFIKQFSIPIGNKDAWVLIACGMESIEGKSHNIHTANAIKTLPCGQPIHISEYEEKF